MSKDEVRLKERMNLYPPRFVLRIRASSTAEDSKVVFTFEGATEEIVKEVIVTKGIVHIICRLLGRCLLWHTQESFKQVAWNAYKVSIICSRVCKH